MKKVKTVILAAGKGTRMKSETPKVLHKIFDKELVAYVIDAVKNISDENFVIVGHQADKVEAFVKNYSEISTCLLQEPQLGTGDAVNKAYKNLENYDGEVLILCGDTPLITEETLTKFIDAHRNENAQLSVMSAIFENPFGYGRIIRDENDNLKMIVEQKDATDEQKAVKEVNTGIYCLNWQKIKSAFSQLKCNNSQGEYYLTDIVSWAVDNGLKVKSYVLEDNDEIYGINSKANLAEASKFLNKKTVEKLMDEGVTIIAPDNVWISPDTQIEADTTILPYVYITGKNKIGKNCKIGPFSHLRGNVTLGDNVRVGNFVEIKNSVIKSNTNVSHLSYIGDSELGTGVNIGAGTITANYNPITKVKSKTIIKDGANTGSNSVLVAPVVMEENSMLAAGSVASKNIEKDSLALTRSPLKIIEGWVKRIKK